MTHLRGVKPALSPDRDALTKAPAVPKRFGEHARAEWKRIMPDVIARRIISKSNQAGIENYCLAIGAGNQIADLLATMPIPDLKLAGLQIRYMQTARQLAAEYGLTPTSRARIGSSASEDDDGSNPMLIGRSRSHA